MVFHLNKLKFSSPKNAFCQVWLKLARRFSFTRRFLSVKCSQGIFVISLLPPLGKKCDPLNLFHPGLLFLPSLIVISPVVLKNDEDFRCQCILATCIYLLSSFGKDMCFYFSLIQGCFVTFFG